jgi:hypothetical protein
LRQAGFKGLAVAAFLRRPVESKTTSRQSPGSDQGRFLILDKWFHDRRDAFVSLLCVSDQCGGHWRGMQAPRTETSLSKCLQSSLEAMAQLFTFWYVRHRTVINGFVAYSP